MDGVFSVENWVEKIDLDVYSTVAAKFYGTSYDGPILERFASLFIQYHVPVAEMIATAHPEFEKICEMIKNNHDIAMQGGDIQYNKEFEAMAEMPKHLFADVYYAILAASYAGILNHSNPDRGFLESTIIIVQRALNEPGAEVKGLAPIVLLATALWFSNYKDFRQMVYQKIISLQAEGFYPGDSEIDTTEVLRDYEQLKKVIGGEAQQNKADNNYQGDNSDKETARPTPRYKKGSRIISADEGPDYKDDEMGVLKVSIAMGLHAFIAYSYSLTAEQLFETIKQNLMRFSVGNQPFSAELTDNRVYLNGIDSQWNYELIENSEEEFSAVVFYIIPIRGDEPDYEWQVIASLMSAFLVNVKNRLSIEDAAIEQIQIPKHNNPFDDNGFSFVHSEVADAFREAVKLSIPYNTTISNRTNKSPSWYKTGDPSTIWNGFDAGDAGDSPRETVSSNVNMPQSGSPGGRETVEQSAGCYIATAVYGSYDCPEVWTLRRFRDYELAERWYGRMFIRLYYAISPTIVRWFGSSKWFNRIWKSRLDSLILMLRNKGYDSTPYKDRGWS